MTLDLYGQQVIELWRNPLNYGPTPGADATAHEDNPLCGDEITLYLKLKRPLPKKITDAAIEGASFVGQGCAISRASSSLLTGDLKGRTLHEVLELQPKRVRELLGVEISAARVKCAMLPLRAAKAAASRLSGVKADLSGLYE